MSRVLFSQTTSDQSDAEHQPVINRASYRRESGPGIDDRGSMRSLKDILDKALILFIYVKHEWNAEGPKGRAGSIGGEGESGLPSCSIRPRLLQATYSSLYINSVRRIVQPLSGARGVRLPLGQVPLIIPGRMEKALLQLGKKPSEIRLPERVGS